MPLKTDGSERVEFNQYANYINVVGDWIYFADGWDSGVIHKMKTNGKNLVKLNDNHSLSICVVGDWIYYMEWDDNNDDVHFCKIRTDGTRRQQVN